MAKKLSLESTQFIIIYSGSFHFESGEKKTKDTFYFTLTETNLYINHP